MSDVQPLEKPRSKKLYIYWGVALALLLALGLFSWLVVVPVWQVHTIVGDYFHEAGEPVEGPQKAIALLGGPERAARRLRAYMTLPGALGPRRELAATILVFCGRPGASACADILKHEKADIRKDLLFGIEYAAPVADPPKACLGVLHDEEFLLALAGSLDDEASSEVPAMAYYRLLSAGPKRKVAVPVLLELLSHRDSRVRWYALGALTGPLPSRAGPALLPVLRDEDAQVRLFAAFHLGEVAGPPENAAAELQRLLQDGDESVRQAAAEALKKIRAASAPKRD